MSSEIIQSVAYNNYDDFQHVNFIFSQIFISLFWGLYNDETDLRVRYTRFLWVGLYRASKRGPLATRWGRGEGVSESSFVVFLHHGGEKKAIAIEQD
jgi:hypothetical protein